MSNRKNLDESQLELLVSQAADEFRDAQANDAARDVEFFAQKYPEIADIVRGIFPALLDLEQSSNAAAEKSFEDLPLKQLGDFKIHREIGRGGMGIVYEATQQSVQRQTALKVLPFANTLDDNQLKRFKNEVRAAGALSHPNIVPVYSMGQERGVHYYAMQLIQGRSLAELIYEQRQRAADNQADGQQTSAPHHNLKHNGNRKRQSRVEGGTGGLAGSVEDRESVGESATRSNSGLSDTVTIENRLTQVGPGNAPRRIRQQVSLILQAADAISHAHECGVIHRDIKPANLMVDSNLKLWVTDFGLARLDDSNSMTLPGDLVGTLRYMSPEQTSGLLTLDHRTDIYSLGVTLYELLTLTTAIRGDSREKIIDNVNKMDPPSPRSLNPEIPFTLNVIVKKSIEKNAEDRYATMQDFAEDLRCFLDDKPIKARRATLSERGRKWARRHPSSVGFIAVFGAVTSIVLAISTGFVLSEKAKTQTALQAQEVLRQRSDNNFGLARDVIKKLYVEKAIQLDDLPGMTIKQRSFLEEVVAFYENVPKEESGSPQILRETAAAHCRLADAYARLGNLKKGQIHYETAIAVLQRIKTHESEPDGTQAIADLRAMVSTETSWHAKRKATSEIEIPISIIAGDSESWWSNSAAKDLFKLASIRKSLGDICADLRQFDRAIAAYNQTLSDLEEFESNGFQSDPSWLNEMLRSRTKKCIANIQEAKGHIEYAGSLLDEALSAQQRLADEFPTSGEIHYQLAATKARCASYYQNHKGDTESAEKQMRSALAILKILVSRSDHRIKYQTSMARMTNDLALIVLRQARVSEGEQLHKQAIELWQKLSVQFPDRPNFRKDLANTYNNMGGTYHNKRRFPEAIEAFGKAVEIMQELSEEFPESPEFQPLLAGSLANLANVYRRVNRVDECRQTRERVLTIWADLTGEYPDRAIFHTSLAMAHYSLADISKPDVACDHLNIAIQIMAEFAKKYPGTPSHQERLTSCLNALGLRLTTLERYDEAEAALLEAIRIASYLKEKWPRVPDYFGKLARRQRHLGHVYYRTEKWDDAIANYNESLEIEYFLKEKSPEYSKSMYAVPIASLHALIGSAILQKNADGAQPESDTHFSKILPLVPTNELKKALFKEIQHVLNRSDVQNLFNH